VLRGGDAGVELASRGCPGRRARPCCGGLRPDRTGLAPADVARLASRPPPPLDGLSAERWRALVEAALRHGLLAALAPRLPDLPEVRTRFERLALGLRVAAAAQRAALDEALGALSARGIAACALKGPVLADRLYPDPALRPSGDLDLLVAGHDLDAAVAALAPAGWRPTGDLAERYHRRFQHHVGLVRPGGPMVELHFRPQSGFGSEVPTGEVLSRARPHRTASGAEVLVLAPEDELLVLALHAAHHLAERAGWLLDLLLLLDAHPALDWTAVAERARRYRCRRAIAYALLLARSLGAAVPDDLVAPAGGARAGLADRLRAAALGRRLDRVAHGLRIAFEAVLCDRPAASLRLIPHHAWWFLRRYTHLAAHPRCREAAGPVSGLGDSPRSARHR